MVLIMLGIPGALPRAVTCRAFGAKTLRFHTVCGAAVLMTSLRATLASLNPHSLTHKRKAPADKGRSFTLAVVRSALLLEGCLLLVKTLT